jgi:hypothetical protein
MASFVDFVQRLLEEGVVILHAPPRMERGEQRQATTLLSKAHADFCLDVAGPPIAFDPDTALAAAERLGFACWFLLHRYEAPAEVENCLLPLEPPVSAAQHLSADLMLRFASQVHRRAWRVDATDTLTKRLEQLLRRYPLSGVLSDIEEGPLTPLHLDGHAGLQLLYAERLADNMRPAWVPEGPAFAHVELVFAERGLQVPVPLASAPANETN